jgi:hypothetical protein
MAQAQTTTTTTDTDASGNGKKREPKALTAVVAIKKITDILDQLSPLDRKRTLAFVNASYDTNDSAQG